MFEKIGGIGGIGVAGCGSLFMFAIGIGIAHLFRQMIPDISFVWLCLIAWLGPYALLLIIIRPWREGF